jgi:hypothetical protein
MEPRYYKCKECNHLDEDRFKLLPYMRSYSYWCRHHEEWCNVHAEVLEGPCKDAYTPRETPWPVRDEYI